jgi:hypothetical protein
MKTLSMLLSILVILSILIPFAASNLPSETTKVAGLENKASLVQTGTTIQQKALESEISHPTPVSGGDSSIPSDQGQTGSDQGQMGSDHQQSGPSIWSTPVTTYPNPVTAYPGLYQTSGNNNLWIESPQGRTQYAVVPQYSHVSLIATTSFGGQGVVYELYPVTMVKGAYTINSYNFALGDNQLTFAADIVGRHILLFSINNQFSNAVAIDVQGSINQQSNGGLLGQGVGV